MRTAARFLLFLVGLAILAYLVQSLGFREIGRLVARTGWGFLGVLAIYGLVQVARSAALYLCQPGAAAVSFRDVFWIRMSGEALRLLTFTGPFLAEPSKVWLMGKRGLETQDGIAAILAEVITYHLAAALLSIVALGHLLAYFEVAPTLRALAVGLIWVMGLFLAVSAIAIVRRIYVIGGIVRVLVAARLLRGRLAGDPREVRRMEDRLLLVLRDRPARLLSVLLLQLAANALLIAEVWWTLGAMGLPVTALYAFLIEGGAKFVSLAFFFIPTQVGVAEGTLALIFDALGLSAAAGVSLSFVRRLRGLALAGVGLIAITILSGARAGSR